MGDEDVSVSNALRSQAELEENCASGVIKAGERQHYHLAPSKTSSEGSQLSHL